MMSEGTELPILLNHDPSRVIGMVDKDGVVSFADPGGFPDSMVPLGLDLRVIEQEFRDGVRYLKKVQLLGISWIPSGSR